MARKQNMHGGYTARKIKALRERGQMMANARWNRHRQKVDATAPAIFRDLAEAEVINFPRNEGDPVGLLQWTDFRSGKVRRWTIRIGDRADRYTMHAADGRATASHGWTWILDHIRGFLAGRKI